MTSHSQVIAGRAKAFQFCTRPLWKDMKRPYGSGAWYGRWRTPDCRRLNRKLGPVRSRGESDGLTRAQAEQAFRRVRAEEAARKPIEPVVEILMVDQVAERLRERVAIEGARESFRRTSSRCRGCTSRRRWASARSLR